MTKEKKQNPKMLSVDALRHNEYYGMQTVFDDLYAKSKAGEDFTDLMDIITSRENILLAYRNIKTNTGSNTAGVDKLTIKDIGCLTPDELVKTVQSKLAPSMEGYTPKPVRRVEIPKPNGGIRPLGIPCIWDRLIQQCTKQVMEPIAEAKFSDNSYGFRPNRSVKHAISKTHKLMQISNLHYVIEFDIKGFFDNVDHSKLMRQLWAIGFKDKRLIFTIRRILRAGIKMPDGKMIHPEKGTPQGGIVSPLLANVVLNELDHWVESQWQENPITSKYSIGINKSGASIKSHGYRAMKKTNLKEMFIVRYADDFRIFCRTKTQAERTKIAVTQWLSERLRLEVSSEKTRVVNVKRRYSEFLGFRIKVQRKGVKGKLKHTVRSHMCDKALNREKTKLIEQAKHITKPRDDKTEKQEIILYNQIVEGIQNYYCIATNVNIDAAELNKAIMTVLTNRLGTQKGTRLVSKGRPLTLHEKERYGKSKMLRFVAGSEEPIYPIGYVQHRNPMAKRAIVNSYMPQGRAAIHDNLRIDVKLMRKLMLSAADGRSAEYADNRISLFSAQWGKCAVTGDEFTSTDEIHCHHIIPRAKGGTDKYENLVLVHKTVHELIHMSDMDTINAYLKAYKLSKKQMRKLSEFRCKAGLEAIE